MEISVITKVLHIEISLDDDAIQRGRISLSMDDARALWRRIGLLLGENGALDTGETQAHAKAITRDYVEWRMKGGK